MNMDWRLYVGFFFLGAAVVGIGLVWLYFAGVVSRDSRIEELERYALELEGDLRASQEALGRATDRNRELAERNQRIANIVRRTVAELDDAGARAGDITQLIDVAIRLVDELSSLYGSGDTGFVEDIES